MKIAKKSEEISLGDFGDSIRGSCQGISQKIKKVNNSR